MEVVTRIGTAAVCCGVLFFLFCVVLVFWYLFNPPKKAEQASAPEVPVQAPEELPGSDVTPGADV
jgi:cbb3-type cytochrome oxidase subunit 3